MGNQDDGKHMKHLHSLFLLTFLVLSVSVLGKKWEVGPGLPLHSIKKALTLSQPFDTLFIQPGIYKEGNIAIHKPIIILGKSKPILDGEGKFEILSIFASKVHIEGLCIRNSGHSSVNDFAGIKIYNQKQVCILNNDLQNCFFGIYSQNSSQCQIENNHLLSASIQEQQSGNGIHCWKCSLMKITGNTIQGHRDGIYFEFVTNSFIWHNLSSQNLRYGLHFMFSNQDTYLGNHFLNNGSGVAVMFSNHVKMYYNVFEENWGDASYGLLLKEISDGEILRNVFIKNTSGIFMEGASRLLIQDNRFQSNGWGMKIQASCMDLTVFHNGFYGNTFDVGTNGTLSLNRFYQNYWDKYKGYDLNKDGLGDSPFRPISLFSVVIENNPPSLLLFRSMVAGLMDESEKLIPSLTPLDLFDDQPLIKPLKP